MNCVTGCGCALPQCTLKIGLGKTPKSKSHLLPRNDAVTETGFVDPAKGEANVTALPPFSRMNHAETSPLHPSSVSAAHTENACIRQSTLLHSTNVYWLSWVCLWPRTQRRILSCRQLTPQGNVMPKSHSRMCWDKNKCSIFWLLRYQRFMCYQERKKQTQKLPDLHTSNSKVPLRTEYILVPEMSWNTCLRIAKCGN